MEAVVARMDEQLEQGNLKGVYILLDNIRSASNIGSIFRSSDAFQIEKILLCGICAVPPNKEILKTALGATATVKWEYHADGVELIKSLKEKENIRIIAIEQDERSIPLNELAWDRSKTLLLIFGNEISGVSKELLELCDEPVEIPQYGMKKSLNVAVAAGIALWELSRKGNS